MTAVAVGRLLAGGTLVGQDSATQFYPWYAYLGEQLRRGEIPEWNPFQFAGAPFAADPQSGWTYLPAMLVFALLPLTLAVPAFLWAHLALAGLGTYALGRALRMPVAAAVVAGTAYQLTGPVYGRAACCPAAMEVATWTPAALLGVELAIRAASPLARLGGWSIAGLALSQGLAAWLGQGSYYLLLATAGFIAYRTLIAPPGSLSTWHRLKAAALHGVAVFGVGFGLAAAGVLPRLDYVARSNLAGGEYAGTSAWAAAIGGVTPVSIFDRILLPTLHYAGASTLALALVALVLARGRFAAPYFVVLSLAGMVLAAPHTTPLHRLLYATLPRFEDLHRHWPERVSLVVYLAPALLAGAAVGALLDPARRSLVRRDGGVPRRALPLLAPLVAVLALRGMGAGVAVGALVAVGAAVLLLAALSVAPRRSVRTAIAALLAVVIAVDLLVAARATAAAAPYGGFHRVDVGDYYAPTGAAAFLRARASEEPGRYFGYDPSLRAIENGQTALYRFQFADPATGALLVNNRATLLGLDDIQGYNPVQVRRYVEFMTALNGHPQEYHDANVFPSGLDSPLLDLLNVRYVVVPADPPPDRADLRGLVERFPTVYLDGEVRVLENPEALPRAWIVHDAIRVAAGEALPLLATGAVDPRTTALLEDAPPPLDRPERPAADVATVTERRPDRLRLSTRSEAAGLLVLSEVYDPGWRAFVDGEPAPVLVADHVLRAVPLPAGAHEVELRYESPALRVGGAITLSTIAVLLAGAVAVGLRPAVRGRAHESVPARPSGRPSRPRSLPVAWETMHVPRPSGPGARSAR